MTLKNNRAPLPFYFKLCTSFRTHWCIQTWVKSPETPNLGQIRWFLEPCDLEIWRMTLKNNRTPLQCYFKLCASFRTHWCIQTWVKSPKTSNLGQIRRFLEPYDLKILRMTLKNNRAPLLSNIKLCATFHHHMWIQTGVTVRKLLNGSWPLWPWPLTSDLDLLHGDHVGQW